MYIIFNSKCREGVSLNVAAGGNYTSKREFHFGWIWVFC